MPSGQNKKINPYVIVIVILVIIIAGLVYNQFGKKIFPGSEEKAKNQASVNDTNPKQIDVKISEGDIFVGNKEALVTIVEYYSYFCGYCKLFHDETYSKIAENYINTGKIKYVFRAYPPYELGLAVLCANEQNKFLEYHNSVFGNASNIKTVDDLKQVAKDIALNSEQFNQCFDSQKYLTKAQEWYEQGDGDFTKAGVPAEERGTPAFFVNGELIIGAQPYEKFVEVIERKLGE